MPANGKQEERRDVGADPEAINELIRAVISANPSIPPERKEKLIRALHAEPGASRGDEPSRHSPDED